MTRRERSAASVEVVLGVDTHLELHMAVALDQLGRRLGELTVPTTTVGYTSLVSWAEGFGPVRCAGVEGTGSYGADIRYPSRLLGTRRSLPTLALAQRVKRLWLLFQLPYRSGMWHQ